MPGTNAIPARSASPAEAGKAAVVSWSVTAIVVTPASRQTRTSSAGESVPSEAVVCR